MIKGFISFSLFLRIFIYLKETLATYPFLLNSGCRS